MIKPHLSSHHLSDTFPFLSDIVMTVFFSKKRIFLRTMIKINLLKTESMKFFPFSVVAYLFLAKRTKNHISSMAKVTPVFVSNSQNVQYSKFSITTKINNTIQHPPAFKKKIKSLNISAKKYKQKILLKTNRQTMVFLFFLFAEIQHRKFEEAENLFMIC